jgi:hypothetical protein
MSNDIGKPTEAQLRLMEEFKASCQEPQNETLPKKRHKLILMVSEDGGDITAIGGDYAPNPEGNDAAPIAFKHIRALQSELDALRERNATLIKACYDFGCYAKAAKQNNTPEYMEEYWRLFGEFERVVDGAAEATRMGNMRVISPTISEPPQTKGENNI